MSRIINSETAGKERAQLSRAILLALRQMEQKQDVDDETRDLAAFVALALLAIHDTIDVSVAAWEKRGYWVKADRFRMDWSWSEKYGHAMHKAIMDEDWLSVAMINVKVLQKLDKVELPKRNTLGNPWMGAWEKLKAMPSSN